MSRPRPRPADDREVVYGRNPVRELIAAGRRPVHEVRALPQVAARAVAGGPAGARGLARRASAAGRAAPTTRASPP